MARLTAFIALWLVAACCWAQTPSTLATGAGKYVFHDPAIDRDVTVYYYKPRNYTPDTPVVFVMHGLRRNAGEYRDTWIGPAEQQGLMVLVPLFKREPYRGSNGYNLGNVFHATTHAEATGHGKPETRNPRSQWAFTLIERAFADFRSEREPNDHTTYDLYGHGAGAQFAHRFAMFMPHSHASHIIVAASGWYTVPDRSVDWPYGIANVPRVTKSDLKAYLAQNILLLVGSGDNRTRNTIMRQNKYANVQGPTRVARSRYELHYAKTLAQKMNVPCNWQRWVMPGVTHAVGEMAPFAAAYFADVSK